MFDQSWVEMPSLFFNLGYVMTSKILNIKWTNA